MDTNVNVNQTQTSATISLGEWMVTTLLFAIPCVGIIMAFVWAFGNTKNIKPSKSNYAKATLIWYAISLVISIICYSSLAAVITSIVSNM